MLNAYMTDKVTVIRKVGNASWGEKSTRQKTVRARVEDKKSLYRNAAGEMVAVQAVIYINEIDIIPSDKIIVDGVEHSILSIKKLKSFSKTGTLEIGIG